MSKPATPPALPTAIEATGLHKSYQLGRVELHVLRGLSFRVRRPKR